MDRVLKILIIIVNISGILLCISCSKSTEGTEPAIVSIKLIDGPVRFDSVIIDIQSVLIKSRDIGYQESKWLEVKNVNAGKYNLLELCNGSEASLGEINLQRGKLSQVWLILGDHNKVVVNGESHFLTILPEYLSNLKVKLDDKLEEGASYNLLVDFDAGRSIMKDEEGVYYLKPVLRAATDANSGAIEGVISPLTEGTVVYAYSETDSISAFPGKDGYFLMRALEPDEYDVLIISPGTSGFNNVVINKVIAREGITTNIDTVYLQ